MDYHLHVQVPTQRAVVLLPVQFKHEINNFKTAADANSFVGAILKAKPVMRRSCCQLATTSNIEKFAATRAYDKGRQELMCQLPDWSAGNIFVPSEVDQSFADQSIELRKSMKIEDCRHLLEELRMDKILLQNLTEFKLTLQKVWGDLCNKTDNTYFRNEVLEMESLVLNFMKFEMTAPSISLLDQSRDQAPKEQLNARWLAFYDGFPVYKWLEENIESVIGINKDDIDEEDDESSTMEPPSRNEAIKAAITLNNFLLSYEKTTPEVLTMLRKIRDEIQGEIDFNKKQKTIESFFKKPS
ncbi:hypothetical protein Tco_0920926 [Tanacetum coccineum]